MFRKSVKRIVKEISPYLKDNEKIESMGVFRKIPTTMMMMFTRGMAMYFVKMNLIIVTDSRIIVFPVIKENEGKLGEPVESVGFDDIQFSEHWLYSTVMEIDLPDEDLPLRLRFSGQNRSLGLDKNDFIGAVYKRKQ